MIEVLMTSKQIALEHMRKLNNSNLGSHSAPEDNFSLVRFIRDKIEGNTVNQRERIVIDKTSAGNQSRQLTAWDAIAK